MNDQVDHMIAERIFFSKIIVQGKAYVGKGTVPGFSVQGGGLQLFPGEFGHMDIGIVLGDVVDIIIYKRGVKRICIYDHPRQAKNCPKNRRAPYAQEVQDHIGSKKLKHSI